MREVKKMQRRSKAEWLKLIQEQERSGLSQQGWCRTKNIKVSTYRDRKSKLSKQGLLEPSSTAENTQISWLTVNPPEKHEQDNSTVRVEINDATILLESGFCESTFLRICKALKTLC